MTTANLRDLIAEAIGNAECVHQPKCVGCMTDSVIGELDRAGLVEVSAEDAALGASAIEGYALAVTGEINPDEAHVIDRLRQAARRLDSALPERTETDD